MFSREIVGFVTNMTTNKEGASILFKKIIVNNGAGKRVKIVGWGTFKSTLMGIDQDGTIVYITALTASIPRDQKYNQGNVPFELVCKTNSRVYNLGMHRSDAPELEIKNVRLEDALNHLDQKISKVNIL